MPHVSSDHALELTPLHTLRLPITNAHARPPPRGALGGKRRQPPTPAEHRHTATATCTVTNSTADINILLPKQVITTSGKEPNIRETFRGRGRSGSGYSGSGYSGDPPSTYNDVDGEVKGLTTASAIWITAGLGMACGAGLFFVATLGAVLTVGILKISEVITSLEKKVQAWFPVSRCRVCVSFFADVQCFLETSACLRVPLP